jgi:beta-lactamase regulating signal transducer with metallopeptidase domain
MTATVSFFIELVFTINLLIACAFIMIHCGTWLQKKLLIESTYRSLLQTRYIMLLSAVILPLFTASMPKADLFELSSKVWVTPVSITKTVTNTAAHLTQDETIAPGWFNWTTSFQLLLATFLLLGFIFHICRLFFHRSELSRFVQSCDRWREIGNTALILSNEKICPFSFRMGVKKYVVLPKEMLTNRSHTSLAIAHEFQHHRQGDTSWSYIFGLLNTLCFWNPAFRFIKRKTEELQEFACDEVLLGRQKYSAQAYGQCLLWTAVFSRQTRQLVLGTTGLAGRRATKSNHMLTRRVEIMMKKNRTSDNKKSSRWLIAFSAVTLTIMSGLGIAANGTLGNVTLNLDEAKMLNAASSQDFPMTINENVLRQLNRYIGTARGRKYVKDSLSRMNQHRNVVNSALSDYQLPLELTAVPVVESGYRNLPPTPNKPHYGAGIWMFIKATAIHFGLKVDDLVDQRLDVELETDAAMRYLKSAHLQFRDWELALLAYNTGFTAVEKGIERTGSRNAWELIKQGYGNDSDYLAKVIAVALIMKNPHLLD